MEKNGDHVLMANVVVVMASVVLLQSFVLLKKDVNLIMVNV